MLRLNRRILLFCICLATSVSWGSPKAFSAVHTLRFKPSSDDIMVQSALKMLADQNFDSAKGYAVAAFDLNDDGVNEWIVREDSDTSCMENATCRFFVIAIKKEAPILLTTIYARKLAIADQNYMGVRTIQSFSSPNDDYAYVPYYWNPVQGRYGTTEPFLKTKK